LTHLVGARQQQHVFGSGRNVVAQPPHHDELACQHGINMPIYGTNGQQVPQRIRLQAPPAKIRDTPHTTRWHFIRTWHGDTARAHEAAQVSSGATTPFRTRPDVTSDSFVKGADLCV